MRVLALNPDHVDARNNLGTVLAELGRPEEAVPHFERALALDQESVAAQSWLAIELAARALDFMTDTAAADIARAEELAARASAASPRSSLVRFAKASNAKVFFVSDTYFTGAEIWDLLAAAGFKDKALVDRLYVSCEAGRPKYRDLFDFVLDGFGLWRGKRLQRAQLHRQGDEPLLRAVVEVPLDAPPRLVSRRDDAGS